MRAGHQYEHARREQIAKRRNPTYVHAQINGTCRSLHIHTTVTGIIVSGLIIYAFDGF